MATNLIKSSRLKLTGYLAGLTSLNKYCLVCKKQDNDFVVCDDCQKNLVLAKNSCDGCGINIDSNNQGYCGKCLTTPHAFDLVHVLYDYVGLITKLIHAFKYNKNLSIGKFFATKISQYYQQNNLNYEIVIPMPIHKKRLQTRGFNQVNELARLIKDNVSNNDVRRIKNTAALYNLTTKERVKELKNSFYINNLQANKILIVDDILTTASTTEELAKTIRNYYKKHNKSQPKIDLLVLARANNHQL